MVFSLPWMHFYVLAVDGECVCAAAAAVAVAPVA